MKLLLTSLIIATLSNSFIKSDTTVYICDSENSKAYHMNKDCFALRNCKHEIRAVSKYDAVNTYGRKLCGHED
jgi:hypothetical protein